MLLSRAAMLLTIVTVPAMGAAQPAVEEYLVTGRLAEGEKAIQSHLDANPDDDEARFGLGAVQFLQSVERLGQFLHQHGVSERANRIPLLRLPIPPNPDPQPTTYADYRGMLETLLTDLATTEATLAKIDGDVKLPLRFGQIRLDLDGDGEATDQEALWRLYGAMNQAVSRRQGFEEQARQFRITFDTGDVYWLRGYCHLLSALIEVQLACDGQRWFDHCGHLLFAKTDTPFPFLTPKQRPADRNWDYSLFLDILAAVHLFDFEVKEPERAESARQHLLAMADLSGKSWDAIVAETDDDSEWLPNAKQESVVGVAVSAEMIATWRNVMGELKALLEGEKLIPFWRDPAQGVNLKRVFTEPKRFDLVLWIQGTAAVPYLEQGETVSPESWRGIQQVFRGEFIGFALWFN